MRTRDWIPACNAFGVVAFRDAGITARYERRGMTFHFYCLLPAACCLLPVARCLLHYRLVAIDGSG